MELLLVILLLGLLSLVVLSMRLPLDSMQLSTQVAALTADLRHTQALALSGGERLCFISHPGGYRISRYDAGTSACVQTPLTDPATGLVFERGLAVGVSFDTASLGMLGFDALGRPLDATGVLIACDPAFRFTLWAGSARAEVTVQALTGRVGP